MVKKRQVLAGDVSYKISLDGFKSWTARIREAAGAFGGFAEGIKKSDLLFTTQIKKSSKVWSNAIGSLDRTVGSTFRSIAKWTSLLTGGGLVAWLGTTATRALALENAFNKLAVVVKGLAKPGSTVRDWDLELMGYERLMGPGGVFDWASQMQAVATARSLGMNPEDIKNMWKPLRDAAAIYGLSLDEAYYSVARALYGETEPAERIGLKLTDNALNEDAIRLFGKEVSKLTQLEKYKVTMASALRQLQRYQGGETRTLQTLTGQFKQFRTALSDAGTELFRGIQEYSKPGQGFSRISGVIVKHLPVLRWAGRVLGVTFTNLANALSKWLDDSVKSGKFEQFMRGLSEWITWLGTDGITKFIGFFKSTMPGIKAWFQNLWQWIKDMVNFISTMIAIVWNLVTGIFQTAATGKPSIAGMFDPWREFGEFIGMRLRGLYTKVRKIVDGIGGLVDFISQNFTKGGVVTTITVLLSGLSALAWAKAFNLSAGFLGWLGKITGISAIFANLSRLTTATTGGFLKTFLMGLRTFLFVLKSTFITMLITLATEVMGAWGGRKLGEWWGQQGKWNEYNKEQDLRLAQAKMKNAAARQQSGQSQITISHATFYGGPQGTWANNQAAAGMPLGMW